MTVTKRGSIRICSITAAAIIALGARNIQLMNDKKRVQQTVSDGYSRAIEDLAASCDKLSSSLEKQLYAGSGSMQQKLAVDLYREASAAKASLAQLPVAELNLENTYKFLSQVGNYSLAMSTKLLNGEKLSDSEYENMASLYDFSKTLSEDMWELESAAASGQLSLSKAESTAKEDAPPFVGDGFSDFEETFDSYPGLIYDGPFSDNILEREPEMTKSAEKVTEEKALQRAAMALDINTTDLSEVSTVEGKMPAWRFSDKNSSVACEVTQNGGYISYFLRSRIVDSSKIENEKALSCAEDFLNYLGILSMEKTYYEIQNNVMTVNYAYKDVDKRVYTDLVKVSVAMDDGEILGYDARGFLVNHRERSYPEKLCSESSAEQAVSPRLQIVSNRLAVIPSDNLEEKLCYEFGCKSETGRNVLVYVNAQTGAEEQILILLESPSGVLTE